MEIKQKQTPEENARSLVHAIESVSEETRIRFFQLLAQKHEWMEDLLDSATIESRRQEPSRPLGDILKDSQ